MALLWVDAGYTGENFARLVGQLCPARVEVIKRTESGFPVLPQRWVVAGMDSAIKRKQLNQLKPSHTKKR